MDTEADGTAVQTQTQTHDHRPQLSATVEPPRFLTELDRRGFVGESLECVGE